VSRCPIPSYSTFIHPDISQEVVQSYFAQLRKISRFRLLSETVVDVTLCRKGRFSTNDESSPYQWVQDCLRPEKDNWFFISCERDSKMSYFAAVSPLLRTGARSIAIMAPLIPVFALAHGSIRALLSWLDADVARNTAATGTYKAIPAAV